MNGKEFLGRGLKFPLQVDPKTGKIAMADQEEDIREAIGIILRTGQGERVMRPEFGANTMDYAFAPLSSSMTNSIAQEVRLILLEQEGRGGPVRPAGPAGRLCGHPGELYGAQHQ